MASEMMCLAQRHRVLMDAQPFLLFYSHAPSQSFTSSESFEDSLEYHNGYWLREDALWNEHS